MTDIAFLGLGAMGSRMAARLIDAGHALTVWNRSPAAAGPLAAKGARVAATPRAAVAGAGLAIAMLRDDEASRAVWLDPDTGALAGLEPDALAIESSTLTPGWVRELGAAATAAGRRLIDAPVSGSRPQAEGGALVFLAGGEEAAVRLAEPALRAMGSAVNHLGPLGAGAEAKLVVNALMGVQVTALAELIGLMRRSGVDPARVLAAAATTTVWSQAAARASASMLAGDFDPLFPVQLIEKDLGYALGDSPESEGGPNGEGGTAPTVAAARRVFADAVARGLGDRHMTAVAGLFA